jgi:hypothetical protein
MRLDGWFDTDCAFLMTSLQDFQTPYQVQHPKIKKMLLVSSKFIFFLPTLVIGQMLRITLNTLGKHQMMFLLMMINSAHTKGEKVIMCIAIHLIYMNRGRLWYNVLPLQVKTAIKQQPSYLQKIQLPKKSLKIP